MKRIIGFFYFLFIPLWVAAVIPSGYYKYADGKTKDVLKSSLHSIISKAKVLDYGSGPGKTWTGFYSTDRYDGDRVRDRYSYGEFRFSSTASVNGASAVGGMNIEHSFPKSWWGGATNQAYKDLFNLMPCEQKINSSKSNYAMGVVEKVKNTNGCTKVGTGDAGGKNVSLWEPADEWKGDFARNYFYMVTAYSNLSWTGEGLNMLEHNEWPTLQKWAYELFLEWNRQDPVDEIEKARNEAVYGIQGNRNPFIDYPNLAEYIWGDSIEYAFDIANSYTGDVIGDDENIGDDGGDNKNDDDTDDDNKDGDENEDGTDDGNDNEDDGDMAFYEDFEFGSKGSYSKGTVVCTMATWSMDDVLLYKDKNANDEVSMRLRSGGVAEMITDKRGGCDMLTFYAGNFNSDTGVTLTVSYSLDGGKTWTSVINSMTLAEWKQYEYAIKQPGNIRLKFEAGGTSGKRINVDDVKMTNYVEETDVDVVMQNNVVSNDVWYDLSGRKCDVSMLKPGIYVHGGKKVVVR